MANKRTRLWILYVGYCNDGTMASKRILNISFLQANMRTKDQESL